MTYEIAFQEYKKLPHVSDDYLSLDGTINHLVFRAQHELDLLAEGEWPDDMTFTRPQQRKIRAFVEKYGDESDKKHMKEHTPRVL